MQYTLDSITHVISCLEEKYPSKKFHFKPLYLTRLQSFFEYPQNENSHRFFYGVLTINTTPSGEGMSIFSENENVMVVDSMSQIAILFQHMETVDSGNFRGQFRGFQIFETT